MNFHTLLDRYRVDDGKRFRLKDRDPADCAGLSIEKREAKQMLAEGSSGCPSCRRSYTPRIAGRC